jgi:putative nucleotidyltransferase with HDIG domain
MAETATIASAPSARVSLFQRVQLHANLSPAAWAWWLTIVAAACAILVNAFSRLGDTATGWTTFAVLTIAGSVAQLTAVHLTQNRVFHPAIVFVVAGALVLTPEQVALMCLLQHIPDWVKQRYAWYIQPFNIANYVLAATATAYVALAVGGNSTGSGRLALSGTAAVVAFVVVNRALLAGMLRLARGVKLNESRLLALDDLALESVLALIAVIFAALYTRSVSLALLSLAPLLLVHLTQRALGHLEQASATIQQHAQRLEETNAMLIQRSTAALEALSATVDARDTYTAGHSRSVRELALVLGRELGLAPDALDQLAQAALLHDIGKIGVPDSVLLKDGSLSQQEWQLMRAHAEEGARIIGRLGYLDEVVPAIRHHHERFDGRGYPDGLLGDDIPLAARIIHVADALDAMLAERVYRPARTPEGALAEIRSGRGTDFCPRCVDALELALAAGSLPDSHAPREAAAA